MPIYEYICPECGVSFELLRPFGEANEQASCPCCKRQAQRKFSRLKCFVTIFNCRKEALSEVIL